MMLLVLSALVAALAACQAAPECKNCVMLNKNGKAIFRAHSSECLSQSEAEPDRVARLLNGEPLDEPALRRHVYCILQRCKLITKDGKPLKAALGGMRADGNNTTKILESCVDQRGLDPVDLAWSLFRCSYDKKAALFRYAHEPDAPSVVEPHGPDAPSDVEPHEPGFGHRMPHEPGAYGTVAPTDEPLHDDSSVLNLTFIYIILGLSTLFFNF